MKENIKEVEIKPCPFCGETPKLYKSNWKFSILHACGVVKTNMGRMRKKEIIEKWNTRINPNKQ